jgi:hypothetical protein
MRKTSHYIAGYLDGRTALRPSFLRAGRSYVFPIAIALVLLFALISGQATYLSCDARKLCVFTRSVSLFRGYFESRRMNDHQPLPAFNARAERVSYSSVFHRMNLEQN